MLFGGGGGNQHAMVHGVVILLYFFGIFVIITIYYYNNCTKTHNLESPTKIVSTATCYHIIAVVYLLLRKRVGCREIVL